MNEDRNRDRISKTQTRRKRPIPWKHDLNPNPQSGPNTGRQSDAQIKSEWTAFHLRKRGLDSSCVNTGTLDEPAEE